MKETYLANLKNIPPNAVRVRVARPSLLSPSKELLKCWKYGYLTWDGYTVWYVGEIINKPEATKKMREIKELAKIQDVYLYCYEKEPPCHRFILMKLINSIDNDK